MRVTDLSEGADSVPEQRSLPEQDSCRAPFLRLALFILLAGLPVGLGAQPQKQDWRIEPFEWQGTLAGGGALSVRNPYGDVRARRSDKDSVAVFAAMQRHRQDSREWTVSIEQHGADLDVEVIQANGEVPAEAAADWKPRRVDLTVYVPADAKLAVETVGGLIEAKRLGGDVEARSVDGEIVITTAGRVTARSEKGRIRYSFLDPEWAGSARLATRAGDITLILPREANVDLTLHTRGEISTDEALVPSGDPGSGRQLQATLGRGGSPVAIESGSGNIKVQRIRS